MMHRALLIVCVLALAACEKARTLDQLDPSRGVIFPEEKAMRLTIRCGSPRLTADGTWLPTDADIARLDLKLAPLLTERLKAQTFNVQGTAIDVYYRQYGGLLVGGNKIIYVNGFREDRVRFMRGDEWRTSAVTVCGSRTADDWHFTALYDPESEAIEVAFGE